MRAPLCPPKSFKFHTLTTAPRCPVAVLCLVCKPDAANNGADLATAFGVAQTIQFREEVFSKEIMSVKVGKPASQMAQ